MKVLLLDDEESRHSQFAKNFFPPTFSARTSAEALDILKQHSGPDLVVCLDYDLDVSNPSDNSLVVAEFIVKLPEASRPRAVVLHTMNESGAQIIGRVLSNKVKMLEWEFFGTRRHFNVMRKAMGAL